MVAKPMILKEIANAAIYTIWAAEFLHDYVYLAHTIGVNLWEDKFSPKHGSPRKKSSMLLKL